ncbi:hypothetical protein CERZMDRAFT_103227 [Cercospora zeae-maydis SCOH1-5]|uniref:Uncharacterized protein n=1 Tax=Cercospora zeae-maydis SCOH1-5 TaxID=717836 RepID=A0A6A6F200_9PEZI|nr:hypothetical protein CERZMDRAFT_103227 [Cercospora zeae-maydis SCOH1-5]
MADDIFARDPQTGFDSDGDPSDRGRQFSAFMSSIYEGAVASTRSVDVVTQTTTLNDAQSTADTDADDSPVTTTTAWSFPTASPGISTTLATQSSSRGNAAPQQTPSTNQQQVPHTSPSDHGGRGGLSGGKLAAAIAVPIIVAFSALAAFLLFRRRRKSRQDQQNTHQPSTRHRGGAAGWRRNWGSLRSSASSNHDPTPEVRSVNNQSPFPNAFVPIGTASHDEPPPPYPVVAPPRPAATPQMRQLHVVTNVPRAAPRSTSPVSPISASDFLSPNPSFMQSARRGSTSASINSDAYSETASIHSARAARMSVGGPTMIAPSQNTSPHSLRHDRGPGSVGSAGTGDPFEDARRANTPSLEGLRVAMSGAGSPKNEDLG